MKAYKVEKIVDLCELDLTDLIKESKEEGFRIIERLVTDYENGKNTFTLPGEALYGVFDQNELVAIGGLNRNPFSDQPEIGRVRRFYVNREYRKQGIGTLLLEKIMTEAKKHYKTLVLHTNTDRGHYFYKANGFIKDDRYEGSTHFMELESDMAKKKAQNN